MGISGDEKKVQEEEEEEDEEKEEEEEFARLKSFESPHSRKKGFTPLPLAQAQPGDANKSSNTIFPSPGGRSLKTDHHLGNTSGSKKRMYIPLDLATLPGVELLSKQEKELCVTNRMLPVQFLMVKQQLMKLSQERGKSNPIKRAEVRTMFKIEPIKVLRVYELLCQSIRHLWRRKESSRRRRGEGRRRGRRRRRPGRRRRGRRRRRRGRGGRRGRGR